MKQVMIKTLILILLVSTQMACGTKSLKDLNSFTSAVSSSTPTPGSSEPGVRIIYQKSNFTWLDSYNPDANSRTTSRYFCPGDVLNVHYVEGGDFAGTALAAVPYTTDTSDGFLPTYKPAFLKNASVDMTNTYYPNAQFSTIQSDACSYRGGTSAPLPNFCADFDREELSVVLPTPAPAPLLTTTPTPAPTPDWVADVRLDPFANSGYYRVRDDWCTFQGPIVSSDQNETKTYIGGANIDLDRSQLGTSEDLIMNITYQSFAKGSTAGISQWPDLEEASADSEAHRTSLKVQLIGTSQGLDELIGVKQPRPWTYHANASYPVYAQDIATLDDPYGGIRTEQVYVPLSQYPLVDRIRIERVKGTYVLYEVDLYKMGERSELIQ